MIKKIVKFFFKVTLLIALTILFTNLYVVYSVKNKIMSINQLKNKDFDYILVLGAGVWGSRPSHLLEDRLIKGIELYDNQVAEKMLMSGDHSQANYDEVSVMENYALENNVLAKDIVLDHAGISTYDSIYRTKEIFDGKNIVIVTQNYHLSRALYIAKQLNLEAYGYSANIRDFSDQFRWDIREIFARSKDFFKVIIKPQSTYLQINLEY